MYVSFNGIVTLEELLLNGAEAEDTGFFNNNVREVLLDGLTAMLEARPEEPTIWFGEWLEKNQLTDAINEGQQPEIDESEKEPQEES